MNLQYSYGKYDDFTLSIFYCQAIIDNAPDISYKLTRSCDDCDNCVASIVLDEGSDQVCFNMIINRF